jgi:hypothetical protein
LGLALYYPFEIWRKRLFFPTGRYVRPLKSVYIADSAACALFFLLVFALIVRHGLPALVFAMAGPYAV